MTEPQRCPCGGTACLRLHSRLLDMHELMAAEEKVARGDALTAPDEAHDLRYECPRCGRMGGKLAATEPEAAREFAISNDPKLGREPVGKERP